MTIGALLTRITQEIVNPLIVLVFLLAVVAFGWGIVMYLGAQGSDDRVEKAKKIMWWGIIGMFVLMSVWGVVYLLCDFFGTCTNKAGLSLPNFPSGGMLIDPGAGAGGIIDPGGGTTSSGIDCSKEIEEMTSRECTYCYPGGLSCGDTLTSAEQTACNNQTRCEPCLHFLDEGKPRAYSKCVKNILGF